VIADYHMHLRDPEGRIAHTLEAIERFVETAARRGVDEIGFTEHVYYFRQTRGIWEVPYQTERCVYDLDAYCAAIEEAKRQGLPVKLGLEVDHVGERQARLAELLDPYPWDFLLGSVHRLDGLDVNQQPGVWPTGSVEAVWRRYFGALGELAGSGGVDVLAHPDLVKIFGRRPAAAVVAELHRRAAGQIAGTGIAVEISTAGLHKPVAEIYPSLGFLRACREHRVPISFASDTHTPEHVGRDFDAALALARDAGYEDAAVFEARERRLVPFGSLN
jgi:histidinol-phosphatase (PHP family)